MELCLVRYPNLLTLVEKSALKIMNLRNRSCTVRNLHHMAQHMDGKCTENVATGKIVQQTCMNMYAITLLERNLQKFF